MGWISYLGLGWIQAIPCLILMGVGFIRKGTNAKEAGKKGLYAISAAGILVQVIKHIIGRPRPMVLDVVGFSLGPSFARGFGRSAVSGNKNYKSMGRFFSKRLASIAGNIISSPNQSPVKILRRV